MIDFKNLYNDLYKSGYHNKLGYTHSKPLIKVIFSLLDKNKKVLDVGCSNGTAALILSDISDVAIDMAKKNGLKDCKVCATHWIDYPDDYFDAILCTDVLEHVDPTEIEKTFQEFYRVTKQKSYYFLKIALNKEFHRGFIEIKKKYQVKNLHVLVRDKKYWFELFKRNNLNLEKILRSNKNCLEVILKKN